MQKLAPAAYAVALVSVMAIPAGPASAQESMREFHDLACIDSKGLCYTDDTASNPLDVEVGYVNAYRPFTNGTRYTNAYRPGASGGIYVTPGSPLAPGLFGIALEDALADYPNVDAGLYSNRYTNLYDQAVVIDDHVAACQARFQSYDAGTDMYLGYDGDYHRCNL
jgi:hypothetical protein